MESNATHNSTTFPYDRINVWIGIILLPVSLFGMVGNGTVIWILGWCIKRNPFTTYVLNLSIADFVVLSTLATITVCWLLPGHHYSNCPLDLGILLFPVFLFTFSMSLFLLAAISIDRCVCLFFPLWHKCHRPPRLSTTVCVAIWILTFLISVVVSAITFTHTYLDLTYYQFLLNGLVFMPAMFISTIAMLIKVCFISPHHKRGKLLSAILLALLFFIFFAFPINAFQFFVSYDNPASFYLRYYALIGASLNSAINPLIYFLVGRDKKAQSRWRIKILEKLFQEEESCRVKIESPLETSL
nr:mas-related G-protein coupled receptor member H-like [Pogona vitticeps]